MSIKSVLLYFTVATWITHAVIADDHQFLYTPHNSAAVQDGLIVYYTQQRSEQIDRITRHPIDADFYLKRLTVRSFHHLTSVDIVSVIYDVANFYGSDRLNELGITRLNILWGSQQTSDGVFSYDGGVVVERELLDAMLSNTEQVAQIREFANGIRRIVPPDSFDPIDDQFSGANEKLGTIHTLNEEDEDWFSYRIAQGGYYAVETLPVESRQRVDTVVEVRTDDQTIVDDDGSDEFLYSRALIEVVDNAAVVVKVTSYGTAGGYYVLSISSVPLDEILIDPYEPNDTIETAKDIVSGSEITAMLNSNEDVDWFEVQGLKRGRTYELLIFSDDYDTTATLFVGDRAGPSLEFSEFSPSGRFQLESKGRIFLMVVGGWSGEYTIVIQEDDPPRL